MEQHITADRIANSIMQEEKFEGGAYLLVEGAKDIKVYGRLVNKSTVRIRQTHGKYKQRDVYKTLTERGFSSKLCVRDADFLRVPGNEKYIPEYTENIFATDGHDSEVMMINSEALNNLLLITSTDEKIKAFESKHGCDIRTLVLELAKPIGYLRYANKKYKLGLSFKPERPEGRGIKFRKFICDKNFEILSIDAMINTIYEYSRNRGQEVSSREILLEKHRYVSSLDIPILELVNGHDASEILSIVITKGLQSDNKLIQDQASVESALTLAYELRYFHNSNLFVMLKKWSESNGVEIL
ncbi:hypothetical protein ACJ7VZ_19940 [Aeromonas salmonicida]|uniref:hypothetical protein n=1 Tax=Aeromonas salmonicida TaxID=645 RepID=UPI0038B9D1B0